MKSLTEIKELVTKLPRGGYLLNAPVGYIQFGAPPETIKDTMLLPESVPQIFVLPKQLFHREKGISIAELEFPIYYNFFIKKRRTQIICTRKHAIRLVRTLQEAVFGPKDVSLIKDVHPTCDSIVPPDIKREMAYFRGNVKFSDILGFAFIEDNICKMENVTIKVDENKDFDIYFDNKLAAHIPGNIEYEPKYSIGERLPDPYKPPLFGVTCLGPSHGFDPVDNTSGYIIWLNHNGIMVDPPVNSTEWLNDSNVNPKLIDSIILTHCHADHDAGTFQKILEEGKITIYATLTVINSFLRKYASLINEPISYLTKLFRFHPIYLGRPVFIHNGEFNIFYTLHSIPTIGFTLKFQNQTFVYSSDHQGDPEVQKKLFESGVINEERYRALQQFPWDSKVIYHESGIPPLHTPLKYLDALPREIKERIVVYHIARKDFPEETVLKRASFGIENTLYFETTPPHYESIYQTLGVLKHLDFFDSLPVGKVQEFVSIIEREYFKKGEIIIREGTTGDKFYIIFSGNVAIEDKKLVQKKIFGTYEYFGEGSLMTNVPRTANVIAETDVEVFTITKDKFLNFINGTEFEITLRRLIKNRRSGIWNILAASRFFYRMSSYQRTWLESILEPVELSGSGVLIQEGRLLEQIYIIASGKVFVSKKGKKVAELGQGDFIGALYKIQRQEEAEYSFSYNEPLTLLAIKKQDALEFIGKNPGLGVTLSYDF